VVEMVSVSVTGAPFGVTLKGENMHCDSDGRPEQLKLIVCGKLLPGVMVRFAEPLAPATTPIVWTLDFSVNAGGMTVTVWGDEVEFAKIPV
jgi:hypothetical protein